jgi:sugar lactone lactonase YvrE
LWRYKLEDNSCVIVDEGPFTDSNGLGWSHDGKTFYFTDSLKNIIYAYDYDEGELSNRRVFIDALAKGAQENSFADGFCLDDEGGIWSARWGGSRIIRYNKDGEPDAELIFPSVLRVTACTFGGPNNDQMYVTSAHCGAMGGDTTKQTDYPDSGHLFVVDLSGKFKGAAWRHHFPG